MHHAPYTHRRWLIGIGIGIGIAPRGAKSDALSPWYLLSTLTGTDTYEREGEKGRKRKKTCNWCAEKKIQPHWRGTGTRNAENGGKSTIRENARMLGSSVVYMAYLMVGVQSSVRTMMAVKMRWWWSTHFLVHSLAVASYRARSVLYSCMRQRKEKRKRKKV